MDVKERKISSPNLQNCLIILIFFLKRYVTTVMVEGLMNTKDETQVVLDPAVCCP